MSRGANQEKFRKTVETIREIPVDKRKHMLANASQEAIRRINNKEYAGTINSLTKTLVIAISLGDDVKIGCIFHHIGLCHRGLKSYNKAISYFERSLQQFRKIKRWDCMANVIFDETLVYTQQGQYEQALEVLERVETNIDMFTINDKVIYLYNKGFCFLKLDRSYDAYVFYSQVQQIYKENTLDEETKHLFGKMHIQMGDILLKYIDFESSDKLLSNNLVLLFNTFDKKSNIESKEKINIIKNRIFHHYANAILLLGSVNDVYLPYCFQQLFIVTRIMNLEVQLEDFCKLIKDKEWYTVLLQNSTFIKLSGILKKCD